MHSFTKFVSWKNIILTEEGLTVYLCTHIHTLVQRIECIEMSKAKRLQTGAKEKRNRHTLLLCNSVFIELVQSANW